MHFRSILSGTLALLLVQAAAALASGTGQHAAKRFSCPSADRLAGHFRRQEEAGAAAGRAAADAPRITGARRADPADQRHDRGAQLPGPADAGADAQDAGRQRVPLPGARRRLTGRPGSRPGRRRRTPSRDRQQRRRGAGDAGAGRCGACRPPAARAIGEVIVESPTGDPRQGGRPARRRRPSAPSPSTRTAMWSTPTATRRRARRRETPAGRRRGGTAGRQPRPASPTARWSPRCPPPTTRTSSTAIPTSSSCRATTARPRQGFRDHIARFPTDPKAADAHYWLGESLLGQQKYRDAAEVSLPPTRTIRSREGAGHAAEARRFADRPEPARRRLRHLQGNRQALPRNRPTRLKERVKQEQALAAC